MSNARLHAQGDWGTQFGMLIQHLDDSREGGLAGGAAEEDVKDLQARQQLSRPCYMQSKAGSQGCRSCKPSWAWQLRCAQRLFSACQLPNDAGCVRDSSCSAQQRCRPAAEKATTTTLCFSSPAETPACITSALLLVLAPLSWHGYFKVLEGN